MKKLITILLIISIFVMSVYALTGTYTDNSYFYLPGYGAYGVPEWTEYNTYMQTADDQIEANKTFGMASVDTSGTPLIYDYARFTDSDTIQGRDSSEVRADLNLEIGIDVLAEQIIGIANNNLLEVDGTPDTYEYARFTVFGLEGRDSVEVRSDLNIDLSLYYLKTEIDSLGEVEAIYSKDIIDSVELATALADYYLKTAIDTLGEVETIYGADITDSIELASALTDYYLKTAIDSIEEMEAIWSVDITDSTELASALTDYYLKTAIDSIGEMEAIWGKDITDSVELASALADYYLKTEIDSIGEMEAIWGEDITDSTELASALADYYLKTAIDTLGEVEAIYSKDIIDSSELEAFDYIDSGELDDLDYTDSGELVTALADYYLKTAIDSLGEVEAIYGKDITDSVELASALADYYLKTEIDELSEVEAIYGIDIYDSAELFALDYIDSGELDDLDYTDSGELVTALLDYYLKTAVDTLGEVETIYGKDITDSTELAAALADYYLKTAIDTLGEVETIYGEDITDSTELASALADYYLKTAIDTLGEVETIYSKDITDSTELASALVDYYLKTAIDTIGEMEAIWSKDIIDSTELTDANIPDDITIESATSYVKSEIRLIVSDADPDTTGEIKHDSSVVGMAGGALRWFDVDSSRMLVDLETDPSTDDYIVAYDADSDIFYMKVDATTGGGAVDVSGTPVQYDFARFTDADTIEGRDSSEVKADLNLEVGTDILAQQTIGIADDNLLEVDDADAADDDYAKFTSNGLEGRDSAEVKADLSLDNVENLKVKLDGTAAPTVNNDTDEGYVVGSRWFDVTNDKEYVCLDNTDGAAVWTETTQSASGGKQLFTASDTFTVPAGITTVYVTGCAGGGGGGGATTGDDMGGGGGGAHSVISTPLTVTPEANYDIVIGAAGSGGAGSGGAGGDGGLTSFEGLLSLDPGLGGKGTGDGSGGAGGITPGYYGIDGTDGITKGEGGYSMFGTGGTSIASTIGGAGGGNGAGGGGGQHANNAGGAGSAGFLLIEW